MLSHMGPDRTELSQDTTSVIGKPSILRRQTGGDLIVVRSGGHHHNCTYICKGQWGPPAPSLCFTLGLGKRVPNSLNTTLVASVFAVSGYFKFKDTVPTGLCNYHMCQSPSFAEVATLSLPARQNSAPTLNQVAAIQGRN